MSRRWVEAFAARSRDDLERLEQTARMRVGRAVLDVARRPWRVLAAVRSVIAALATGGAGATPPLAPPYPASPLEPDRVEDHRARERAVEEYQSLLRRIDELHKSPAFRVGTALVEPGSLLRRVRRRLGYQPPPNTRRPGRAPRRSEPAATRTAVESPPPVPLRWRCAAPRWLEEMLGFEGVPAFERGGASGDALLVGANAGSLSGAGRARLERALARAGDGGAPSVVWLLDRASAQLETHLLERFRRVYAADPQQVSALAERLSVPVEHLAPAVQPRLQNPIGWWGGAPELGVAGLHEGAAPELWRTLFGVARAQPHTPARIGELEAALAHRLPEVSPPAWADQALAHDFARAVRLRHVIDTQTVAHRLCAIERALGVETRAPNGERVSALVVTNRPHRLEHVCDAFERQRCEAKELVLVLHGDAFDERAVRRRLDALSAPVRVVEAPASLNLGQCEQKGCMACETAFICRMDDDDWYGAHYLSDFVAAMRFSDAGIVGKITFALKMLETGRMHLCSRGAEYRYALVRGAGARMGFRREVLDEVEWAPRQRGGDDQFLLDTFERAIPHLATSCFDFVYLRGDPSRHTSKRPAADFLKLHRASPLPAEARVKDFET